MSRNYHLATKLIQNIFIFLIHFSSLEVLLASTYYSRSDPDGFFKVNRTPVASGSKSDYENFMVLEDDEYEVGYYDNGENQQTSRNHTEEFYVNNRVFLELLIFICCAAGVFGVCIFCCIICGQIFDCKQESNGNSSSNGNSTGEENLPPYLNNRAIRIQHGEDGTIMTFISVHRNPWSPVFDGEQEPFRFDNDGHIDMPPPYEELDLSKKPEEPYSPPPPPYTPSFCLVNDKEKKFNILEDEKKHQHN